MAMTSNNAYHCRSKSSPIELHPFLSQFRDLSRRLRFSEGVSTSQELVCQKLNGLVDLHSCVDSMFQMSCIQQGVSMEQYEGLSESLLDSSVWLIDVCGVFRDVLMQTLEVTQQLRSVLRRRPDELELFKEVGVYMNSRKVVRKVAMKFARDAKSFGKKVNTSLSDEIQQNVSFLSMLEESQSISVKVLDSLFSYIASPKMSLICKLVRAKQVATEEGDCSRRNIFDAIDDSLHMLISQKSSALSISVSETDKLKCDLEDLESIALDFERSIECLSRLLIRSRVALLNIVSH